MISEIENIERVENISNVNNLNELNPASGSTTNQQQFYPYIEGTLYKKGNGIISSVWSYRHFELDINEQTLRWYKFKNTKKSSSSSSSTSSNNNNNNNNSSKNSNDKNDQRIERGVISLCFATAELLKDKKKKLKYSKMISGEIFIIKYYPNAIISNNSNSEIDLIPESSSSSPGSLPVKASSSSLTTEGNEQQELNRTASFSTVASSTATTTTATTTTTTTTTKSYHPTGPIQEMYLSAPCLEEAYHWITHVNLASKIHLKEVNPLKLNKQPSISSLSKDKSMKSQETKSQQLPPQQQQRSQQGQELQSNPLKKLLLKYKINPKMIYFFPIIPLLFPYQFQVYIAIGMIYWLILNYVNL